MEEAKKTNVMVCARCRPLNEQEKKQGAGATVKCDVNNQSVALCTGRGDKKVTKSFTFDRVFGAYSTQQEVFNSVVRPMVGEVLEGYNSTLFAFGPTGTGKTHTMEGEVASDEMAGIVPRAVRLILERLEQGKAEYTVRVSFLELYNEELLDLLADSKEQGGKGNKPLRLCEDVNKGVVCQNLEEVTVMGADHVLDILKKGIKQRATAATNCNKNSSRSHSIFTLKIMIKETNVEGLDVVRHGQLNLVDLAGSECVGRSGVKGEQKREAGSINQSLLTLGRVITALVDHHGHVPYRDSKLTRLLQESLGGKAKTCIIATLSPSHLAYEETLSTLEYAHRARAIKNVPQVNARTGKRVVMKEFAQEIEQLRTQLQMTREKNGVYMAPDELERMENKLETQEAQLAECEAALKAREDEMKDIRAEREMTLARLDKAETELKATALRLVKAEANVVRLTEDVAEAQMEQRASEAIVGEQCATETELTSAASTLGSELSKRRADVNTLLAKVHTLVTARAKSEALVSAFCAETINGQDRTRQELTQMRAKYAGESKAISDGVDVLLAKGRETCEVLNTSVGVALKSLMTDVQAANGIVSIACEKSRAFLGDADSQVVKSLSTVQHDLSVWLGEVSDHMQKSRDALQSQSDIIAEITTGINNGTAKTKKLHETFVDTEATHVKELNQSLKDMSDEMDAVMKSWEKAEQKSYSQVQGMNKTMQTLAQQLMEAAQEQQANLDVMQRDANQRREHVCSGMTQKVATLAERTAAHHKDVTVTFADDATRHADSFAASALEGIKGAAHEGESVSNEIEYVRGAVGDRRNGLDASVGAIVKDVHAAIEKSTEEVNEAERAVEAMLTCVSSSSDDVTSKTSSATGTFTTYMAGSGRDLCTAVAGVADVVDAHLSERETAANEVDAAAALFKDHFSASRVPPTGGTPTKTAFPALLSLPATRAHEDIKREVRAGTYSAPTGASTAVQAEMEAEEKAGDDADKMDITSTDEPALALESVEEQTLPGVDKEGQVSGKTDAVSESPGPASAPVVETEPEAVKAQHTNKRISRMVGPTSRKRGASSVSSAESENADPQGKVARPARSSRRGLGETK